jgi:hypothetical protein
MKLTYFQKERKIRKMNMLKKTLVLVLIATIVSLGVTGCKGNSEHPSGDHPTNDTPDKDAPDKETPDSEHPAGEHPTGEHPTGEHPK